MFGLRSKIDDMRQKWQLKTPKQKFAAIFDTGRMASEALGIRVYSDMKTYWYTPFAGVVILTCFALIFYTIPFYCLRNEFIRSIECTCPLGIIIPVSRWIFRIYSSFSALYFFFIDTFI